MTTAFIARHEETLAAPPRPTSDLLSAAADNSIWNEAAWDDTNLIRGLCGFRLNGPDTLKIMLSVDGKLTVVPFDSDAAARFHDDARLWPWVGDYFFEDGAAFHIVADAPRGTVGAGAHDGDILAPMPGKVTSVEVAAGDSVTKGQRLLTLEAMKMEHGLTAPFDGVVAELNTSEGAQVQVDAVLAKIKKSETP